MNSLNKIALTCIVCLAFAGCASQSVIPKAEIPASLTAACEPLEQLTGMTGKDLVTNITNNAAIHWKCVDRYNALIEATKNK